MFSMATGLPRLTAASTRRKEDRTDSVDPATRTPGVFFFARERAYRVRNHHKRMTASRLAHTDSPQAWSAAQRPRDTHNARVPCDTWPHTQAHAGAGQEDT